MRKASVHAISNGLKRTLLPEVLINLIYFDTCLSQAPHRVYVYIGHRYAI